MLRRVLLSVSLAVLLASSAFAADWTEYRMGPFRVISNAGDRAARERLTEMEQTRHVLAGMLGKTDLQTVWPIVLVLFPNQKEYGPHALPQPFVPGGSSDLSAWTADTPQPQDWRREIVRRLIADNAGLLSGVTLTALQDLFSTIEVNATRVKTRRATCVITSGPRAGLGQDPAIRNESGVCRALPCVLGQSPAG